MDYKYIEQLLERYWAAETTLQEESILRAFFSQPDIPAEFEAEAAIFMMQSGEASSEPLGDDFDARILQAIAAIEDSQAVPVVKAREIRFTQRLRPLFKAAAVVAIVLTLGNAIGHSWDAAWDEPNTEVAEVQGFTVDSADVVNQQAENIGETAIDSAVVNIKW